MAERAIRHDGPRYGPPSQHREDFRVGSAVASVQEQPGQPMNLPASPAARRREEEVRIRQRLEAMDSKLDACLGTIGGEQPGGGQAPPPPPAVPDLGLALGQDPIFLPAAVLINRRLNDDGEEEATSIRVDHL